MTKKLMTEPMSIRDVYDRDGLEYAIWCLRGLPEEYDNDVRLLLCDLVEPMIDQVAVDGDELRYVIRTARAYDKGFASEQTRLSVMFTAFRISREAHRASEAYIAFAVGHTVVEDEARAEIFEAFQPSWFLDEDCCATFEAWLDEMEARE